METNLPGVFAAGDIAAEAVKMNLIATGYGQAALAVNIAKNYIDPPVQHLPRPQQREDVAAVVGPHPDPHKQTLLAEGRPGAPGLPSRDSSANILTAYKQMCDNMT